MCPDLYPVFLYFLSLFKFCLPPPLCANFINIIGLKLPRFRIFCHWKEMYRSFLHSILLTAMSNLEPFILWPPKTYSSEIKIFTPRRVLNLRNTWSCDGEGRWWPKSYQEQASPIPTRIRLRHWILYNFMLPALSRLPACKVNQSFSLWCGQDQSNIVYIQHSVQLGTNS